MITGERIVLESSLQVFFFNELQHVNAKCETPLRNEIIFYSSNVMDDLSDTDKYFELVNGHLQQKLLGPKLLESDKMGKSKQKHELKNIGDTALLLCGLFPESLESKIVDVRYYQDLGKMAYQKLNYLVPTLLDIESFYSVLAKSFDNLTSVMSVVASKFKQKADDGTLVWMAPQRTIKVAS
jgi:hypothetical protein